MLLLFEWRYLSLIVYQIFQKWDEYTGDASCSIFIWIWNGGPLIPLVWVRRYVRNVVQQTGLCCFLSWAAQVMQYGLFWLCRWTQCSNSRNFSGCKYIPSGVERNCDNVCQGIRSWLHSALYWTVLIIQRNRCLPKFGLRHCNWSSGDQTVTVRIIPVWSDESFVLEWLLSYVS